MDNLIFIELPPGINVYCNNAMNVSIDQFRNDCIHFFLSCEWDNYERMDGDIPDAYFDARVLLLSGLANAERKEVTGELLHHVIEKRLAAGKKTFLTADRPRESLHGLNLALYDLLMTAKVENISQYESAVLHQSP